MEFFFKSSYALIVPRQLVLVIDKITDLIAVNPRREQVDFLLSEITDQLIVQILPLLLVLCISQFWLGSDAIATFIGPATAHHIRLWLDRASSVDGLRDLISISTTFKLLLLDVTLNLVLFAHVVLVTHDLIRHIQWWIVHTPGIVLIRPLLVTIQAIWAQIIRVIAHVISWHTVWVSLILTRWPRLFRTADLIPVFRTSAGWIAVFSSLWRVWCAAIMLSRLLSISLLIGIVTTGLRLNRSSIRRISLRVFRSILASPNSLWFVIWISGLHCAMRLGGGLYLTVFKITWVRWCSNNRSTSDVCRSIAIKIGLWVRCLSLMVSLRVAWPITIIRRVLLTARMAFRPIAAAIRRFPLRFIHFFHGLFFNLSPRTEPWLPWASVLAT